MTITINIAPDLQPQLRRQAAQAGLDPGAYIARLVEERLRKKPPRAPHLSSHETELLRQINRGLTTEEWERYRQLIAKRRAESLTPEEHTDLIAFSDQIEEANVRRAECLVELARLRGVQLETLMDDLGLRSPAYG